MLKSDRSNETHGSRTIRRLAPLLIGLAVVYAYSNACKGPFIFDDVGAIEGNVSIRSLWPIWKPMFPRGDLATSGRPLVGLSLALNYAFDGLNPGGYHAFNVAMHFFVSLTLLGVFRRVLRRLSHPNADAIALAAGLIWAVHPLLTDAVTYVINRSEVMMSLFFVLTLYTFLRSFESMRSRTWLALSIGCALMSVASKEVGAMVVPVILIFDVLFVARSWRTALRERRWYYAGLLLTWALLPFLLLGVSMHAKATASSRLTSWEYLLMQSQIIVRYLRLSFWPAPLVICYVDWPVPKSLWDVWPWMTAVGGLLASTIYLVIKKNPAAMVGVCLFLILAPSSSLLPLPAEPAAERRMYLPLAAIVLGVTALAERLIRRVPHNRIWSSAIIVLVLVLGQVTLWRNEDYSSELQIWTDTVAKRPRNPRAQSNLGLELMKMQYFREALDRFNKALEILPNMIEARVARGMDLVYLNEGKRGIEELMLAIRMNPQHAESWAILGWAWQMEGNPALGEKYLRHALELDPDSRKAQEFLQNPGSRASLSSPQG